MLRSLLGSLHLLGLGIGLGAIVVRAWALRRVTDGHDRQAWVARALMADNLWGLAALLWIGPGLLRAFGGWEKGTAFYLDSTGFWIKMGLFIITVSLELWPMITLIRWRIAEGRGQEIDTTPAAMMARISEVEAALTVLIVIVAGWMARGVL
jgi:putative membrane protein